MSFVNEGLGSFPDYFWRLPAVNQTGVPADESVPILTPMSPGDVASVLQRAGHADVAVLRGGFTGWAALSGHEPATG